MTKLKVNFLFVDTELLTSTGLSQAIKEKQNIDSMAEITRVVIVDIQFIYLLISWS